MYISKLTDKEFDQLSIFAKRCNYAMDYTDSLFSDEQWRELDDDDIDKIAIQQIRKRVSKEEKISEDDIDFRIIAFEYMRKCFNDRQLKLCVLSAKTMIDYCCDPFEDTLRLNNIFFTQHVMPEQ